MDTVLQNRKVRHKRQITLLDHSIRKRQAKSLKPAVVIQSLHTFPIM